LHPKKIRPGHWPWRRRGRRIGADAAFAKVLARSEFGRFYSDDREQREIAQSLLRARKKRNGVRREAPQGQEAEETAEKKAPGKVQPWRSASGGVSWQQQEPG
jgi:hypothetical protein